MPEDKQYRKQLEALAEVSRAIVSDLYLEHILQAIDRIAEYTSRGEETFRAEPMVQDAVIRNLEVIGEAVKNLSPDLRALHDDVPWRQIAAMRDRMIHGYFHVNLELVWSVVQKDIPPLRNRMKLLLEQR